MITIQVPPAPQGKGTTCWRKAVAGITAAKGGSGIEGQWLQAGDTVMVPDGTILIAVDKTSTGWDNHHRTGEPYRTWDATVTLYTVASDGLAQKWQRHFKTDTSACGATTRKQLQQLLDAASGTPTMAVTVVAQAQARRPKRDKAAAARAGRTFGGAECAECGERPARHARHDSSGILGMVCAKCAQLPDYVLSFA
jgi:hypothetical protein